MNKAAQKIFTFSNVFLLAVFLRVAYLGLVLNESGSEGLYFYDSYQYEQLAENIIQHSKYSIEKEGPYFPNHTRTPVYPLTWAFFKFILLDIVGLIVFQIGLALLNCYLLYQLIHTFLKNKFISAVGMFFLAIDLPSIVLASSMLTETVFATLLLFSVLFLSKSLEFTRWKNYVYAGFFLGLAILCRPIAVFLPILIFLSILFLQRKSYKKGLVIILISSLTISPWLMRNYHTHHTIMISSIGATNLLLYRAADVKAQTEEKSLENVQQELWNETWNRVGAHYYNNTGLVNDYMINRAKEIIIQHPVVYAKSFMINFIKFWIIPVRSMAAEQLNIHKNSLLISGLVAIQMLLQLLILLFCALHIRKVIANKLFLIITLIIMYFAFLSAGPELDARFRVVVQPFIILVASLLFASIKTNHTISDRIENPAEASH